MHIDTEIDNLYYRTIERIITDYFDMGSPDNSNIPPNFAENHSAEYILIGTKKSGTFNISVNKLTNGKYNLWVTLKGKLHIS